MATIAPYQPESEFDTPEGCFITELHKTTDDPACSIALARMPEGKQTRWHRLRDTAERYVIIEGQGDVEVGDEAPVTVHRLDVVNIPADTAQRITNTGQGDLVFLCICTPSFSEDCYIDCDEEQERESV